MIWFIATLVFAAEVTVLGASRNLPVGVPITADDLFQVDIDDRYLPAGIHTNAGHVIGRIPRTPILVHEFIRDERLADARSGYGINVFVPRNLRAINLVVQGPATVAEDWIHLLAPMAPGDQICILADTQYVLATEEGPGHREILLVADAEVAMRLSTTQAQLTVALRREGAPLPAKMCPGVTPTSVQAP